MQGGWQRCSIFRLQHHMVAEGLAGPQLTSFFTQEHIDKALNGLQQNITHCRDRCRARMVEVQHVFSPENIDGSLNGLL